MMNKALTLSPLIRNKLWRQEDWCQRINEQVQYFENGNGVPDDIAAWALVAESIVPDRSIAIKLYLQAWRGKHELSWIERARTIALECADFRTVAKIAGLEFEQNPRPHLLLVQALALLDADFPADALPFFRQVMQGKNENKEIQDLVNAIEGKHAEARVVIGQLIAEARNTSSPRVGCDLLLLASRLSRILVGGAEAEPLLSRAFKMNPENDVVFSLLENWWIRQKNWGRLSELYRLRTEFLKSVQGNEIDLYRRAGTRLATGNVCPGLGVRILEQGVKVVYQKEMENVPFLLAMLRLLCQQMVDSGAQSNAIRLLAQALAHPRTDDEVMWIVSIGIALAEGDDTMRRTNATFEILRAKLLKEHALLEKPSEDEPEDPDDSIEWLEDDTLVAISDELNERVHVGTSSQSNTPIAEETSQTFSLVADLNIRVRAKWAHNDRPFQAITRDIGVLGLYLSCSVPLMLGDEIYFVLLLPGQTEWDFKEHKLRGVVIKVDGISGYKIRFLDISDGYEQDILTIIESPRA